MSITTTGLMKQQLMSEPTDLAMASPMEGGVNRPSMAGDLARAMNDIDFKQLMEQYAAMSGLAADKPMTKKFMQKEKQRVDDETGKPLTKLQEDIMDKQMPGYSINNEIMADEFLKECHPHDNIEFKTPVHMIPNVQTGMPEGTGQGVETYNVNELSPGLMTNPFPIKI